MRTKVPLHAKQAHSEQALLAQNIVSNGSTTVTNFWFESLIPSESRFSNKQHSIKAIQNRSQLHRPLREDSPIISDDRREDREIINLKRDDAHHRQTQSAEKQIQSGERVTGIGDQVGRRRRGQQKRAGAAARDREQQHERVDLTRRRHADHDGDHDAGAGGIGGENADDGHDHFDQERREELPNTPSRRPYHVQTAQPAHLRPDPRRQPALLRPRGQREAAAEQKHQIPGQFLRGAPRHDEFYVETGKRRYPRPWIPPSPRGASCARG